jgi:hypothetical protein
MNNTIDHTIGAGDVMLVVILPSPHCKINVSHVPAVEVDDNLLLPYWHSPWEIMMIIVGTHNLFITCNLEDGHLGKFRAGFFFFFLGGGGGKKFNTRPLKIILKIDAFLKQLCLFNKTEKASSH